MYKTKLWAATCLVLAGTMLAGCPGPAPVLTLNTNSHHFGVDPVTKVY